MNEQANYGNWVPEKMFPPLFGSGAVLLAAGLGCGLALHKPVPAGVCGALGVVLLGYGAYMYRCHEEFAFGKGNMMAKVHEHLVQHLDWDGKGRLLDIGCGAGALTIQCAKAFPEAQLTGMDYWGKAWNYAKTQCEQNAQIEGVADRIQFEKGDAAHLPYPDESFDAAVSNFVFHEVHTAKDKRDVVREALCVVKNGGAFAFQDLFSQKALYGDMDELVAQLKAEGVSEVHFIGNLEKKLDFVPGYVQTPWMISGVGILYGRK